MTFFVANPGFSRTLGSTEEQSATVLLCRAVVTKPIHHLIILKSQNEKNEFITLLTYGFF